MLFPCHYLCLSCKFSLSFYFHLFPLWSYLSFLSPPIFASPRHTLCLRIMVPSCLYWTWSVYLWSFTLADLPAFVWVSVSWSSGHVNRISLFHAQSHPAITDPWGCMECVRLHTERPASTGGYPARRRCAFLQHVCSHVAALCVIWNPILEAKTYFWMASTADCFWRWTVPAIDLERYTSWIQSKNWTLSCLFASAVSWKLSGHKIGGKKSSVDDFDSNRYQSNISNLREYTHLCQ